MDIFKKRFQCTLEIDDKANESVYNSPSMRFWVFIMQKTRIREPENTAAFFI
ncbi:MAG: hypothetical protein ACHP6H_02550 [Legionellales bacterium]